MRSSFGRIQRTFCYCQGVLREWRRSLRYNPLVKSAFRIAVSHDRVSEGDRLILHSLGVAWLADAGNRTGRLRYNSGMQLGRSLSTVEKEQSVQRHLLAILRERFGMFQRSPGMCEQAVTYVREENTKDTIL